jgi:hypothetical protein
MRALLVAAVAAELLFDGSVMYAADTLAKVGP